MPDWTSHSTARWATASEFNVPGASCGAAGSPTRESPGSGVRLAHDLLHRSVSTPGRQIRLSQHRLQANTWNGRAYAQHHGRKG